MKKIIFPILTALFLCLPISLNAQDKGATDQYAVRIYFSSEKLTVSSTAVGFTSAKIAPSSTRPDLNASIATCSVEADDLRWLATTETPTATTGTLQKKDLVFHIYGYTNIKQFRAIRVTTDVTLNCQYGR